MNTTQSPQLIVEGNIGAGKSTFLRMAESYLNAQLVYEPHERWQNIGGHNLLDHFYKDMSRWTYTFQSYAFISRIQAQEFYAAENDKPLQVIERSIYSDRYCFARNLYEMGRMSDLEWQLYQEWFSWMTNRMKAPDAFIYLRTSPEICYSRLKKRNRSEELSVDLDYLKILHDRHEAWLIDKKEIDQSLYNVPVIILECSEDFEHNQEVQRAHVQSIISFLGKNFRLSASQVSRCLSTI